MVGAHLRLRIKRHHAGDEISTYPTRTAIEFWQQGSQLATDRAPVTPHNPSRSSSATISTMRPSIALR
ncbi:hypothetical protein BN9982_1720002 [Mycobacterium tuberculosis]|nr:hypothetical protein BN9982_1720002 [Mycobacterium tuberculosis]